MCWINKLKEKRKEAGISAKELSEAIGVTVTCIYYYESGIRIPNAITLKIIADEIGCTVDDLY